MKFLLCAVLMLSGCGRGIGGGIIPETQQYVDEFVRQAGLRGKSPDVAGLSIQFGDAKGNRAICKQEEKTVVLDEHAWTTVYGVDYRASLIYHELGHCLLNRQHVLDWLPTGNPKSLMYPNPSAAAFQQDPQYYWGELFYNS